MWLCRLWLSFLLFSLIPAQTFAQTGDPATSVGRTLAAELSRHPVIMLGEEHQSARYHALLQRLLRDRRFVCALDDIVLEAGNRLYQSTADRYVSGGRISQGEKARMWRNTTQWLVWDSPVYEQIYDTVREINTSKLCSHPLRVLLADPPIPWAEVHNAADYRKYGERDQTYADIIETEVLARHRRALVVIGGIHINKSGALEIKARPMVAKILEGKYPGKILSVYTDVNPDQAALLGLKMGRLKLVRGTAAGKLSFVRLVPNASARIVVNGETVWKPLNQLTWPAVEDLVDGFLYLGPDSAVAADPAIYRDPTYQAELRRRAPILKDVYSLDFLPELEALLTPPVK